MVVLGEGHMQSMPQTMPQSMLLPWSVLLVLVLLHGQLLQLLMLLATWLVKQMLLVLLKQGN